ncbi:MAG: hypothetical protein DI539_05135 [Flavobacterium psychrophilum]|nr:MAG: hypothetical protein DI539_05135 [Flavobacterium psychrophilum]
MRTTDIVIRLNGQQVPELKIGNPQNYPLFYSELRNAISLQQGDIVHKGDYFRLDHHLLPKDDKGYTTYALFRDINLTENDDDAGLWEQLENQLEYLNYPEIRESATHHQLVELSTLPEADRNIRLQEEAVSEDVLVRIAGTREQLEFDPLVGEGNKILYDRLAKLIYDREIEIMYKGPKLNFDENRDLFINSDEFSIYILFRSRRDSNYEDNELLWSNLGNDLKVLSKITLLKSSKDYQVLLFTHEDISYGDDAIQL